MRHVDDQEGTNIRAGRVGQSTATTSPYLRPRVFAHDACMYSVNKRHLSPSIALHFPFYARSARFMSRFMFRTECAARPEYASCIRSRNTGAGSAFLSSFTLFLSSLANHASHPADALNLSTSFADGDFTSRASELSDFPLLRHTLLNTRFIIEIIPP